MFTTVAIGLPVTPTHSPLRTLSAKAYTLASTSCTSGTTSVAVDDQAGSLGRPQRGVQHRAVLGDVDVFAGQHRVAALRQADLVSKINKCSQDVGVDQVLGKVDIEIAGLEGERLRSRRVGREPAAQIGLQRLVQGRQPRPGRGRRRIYRLAHRVPLHRLGWVTRSHY